MMPEAETRQDYTVTERAGLVVAGRRVSKDDTLQLTAAEADYELGEGTIVPKGKELSKAFTEDKRADKARTEAAATKGAAQPAGPDAGDGSKAG